MGGGIVGTSREAPGVSASKEGKRFRGDVVNLGLGGGNRGGGVLSS